MLIVWRFLQGFAGAGGSVLSRSIARDKYQGTLLTQFFALLMTVNGIAPVLSPVLGGYVITAFDWRILFWTMAAIGGALLVMSLTILRETRPAAATNATRQRPDQPVLKNRRFLRFCLIQAFMMAGLFSYIGSSSFVMQSEYGMSAMQFSLLFGLNGIGLIIAAMIFSRLARRFSAESLLRGGLTLAVSCAAIMLLFAWLQLPVLALVMLQAGSLTRYVRASMLDVVKMDFIRTARAKGLHERTVILKHALRNALLPIITLLGFELPGLFSGAIITEKVFNWPGAGHIHIDSLAARDYPVLMGFTLFLAVLTIVGNLLADVLYAWADPRIRVRS